MKKIYVLSLVLVLFIILMIVRLGVASGPSRLNSQTNGVNGKARSLSSSPTGVRSNRKASREPTIREVWGEIIDLAEDCQFRMKDGRLSIWVPGSETPHDMNPERGTAGSSELIRGRAQKSSHTRF